MLRGAILTLTLLLFTAPAFAQKFEYGKEEEVKEIDKTTWKATAQGGFILTTGNSRVVTFSGGANAFRLAHRNKFAIDAGGAYAKTRARIAVDDNANGVVDPGEISEPSTVSTEMWMVRGRYDRFLTENNALYVLGKIGAEVHAGKQLLAGGQLGYSRTLVRCENLVMVLEAGYDFSYENYDKFDDATKDNISIHSARGFLGYDHTLTADTSLMAAGEVLVNLNTISDAPGGEIGTAEDTRVEAKAGLKTKLWQDVSFAFTFTARYDHAPAPLPPFAIPYATGFTPLADTLDTLTEAQLVISFL